MLVPFGKYRDQPINNLLANDKYVRWFLGDTDVQAKYPEVYEAICYPSSVENSLTKIDFFNLCTDRGVVQDIAHAVSDRTVKSWAFKQSASDLVISFEGSEQKLVVDFIHSLGCSDYEDQLCIPSRDGYTRILIVGDIKDSPAASKQDFKNIFAVNRTYLFEANEILRSKDT